MNSERHAGRPARVVEDRGFRRRPAHVALGLGLAVAAVLALTLDAAWLREVDGALLESLRNPADLADPVGPVWFEEAMRDVTALGSMVVIGAAVTVMVSIDVLARRPRAALYLALTVAGGIAATFWVKAAVARPRPDLVAHGARVLTHSFPSGHAATAALCYATLGALIAQGCRARSQRWLAIAWAMLAILAVGASRVYLGVHWPSDVVAGWALGGSWALAAVIGEDALRRRGYIERRRT